MEALFSAGLLAIAVIGVVLLIRLFKKPIKLIFKLMWNAVCGFVTLFLLQFLGGFIGLTIEINLIRCIVVGLLGIPGALLLIFLQII